MTRYLTSFLVFTIALVSCVRPLDKKEDLKAGKINISWTDSLFGDFTFKDNWDYPESVYTNQFGQLSCDGLCPPEIDRMRDKNGRIYDDSLAAFYQAVDTTHQFHSIQCDAWCYEWAGTNFATATRTSRDTVICFTQMNEGTHCSLNLIMANDKCSPTIVLNSIAAPGETHTYLCKTGQIKIDQNFWNRGVIKAEFNFTFDHKENPTKEMYWKGKIYTTIYDK